MEFIKCFFLHFLTISLTIVEVYWSDFHKHISDIKSLLHSQGKKLYLITAYLLCKLIVDFI